MTKTLELRAFLRKEVSKTKNILQLPTRRKRKGPHSPSAVSIDPQKSTSRALASDNEEMPVEKNMPTDISRTKLHPRLPKEKSETRLRIEELRAQLLQVIAQSHESSESRNKAKRERERLIREIEVLEVQEKVRRGNALRATGPLPEPISQGEKKNIQKERHRVQKAHEPKRPRIVDADPDLDPDGETRHQLGMSLKRRKIEYTGKWETTRTWPELRYKGYGRERLAGLVLVGASEEQRGWLGRWVRSGVGKGM